MLSTHLLSAMVDIEQICRINIDRSRSDVDLLLKASRKFSKFILVSAVAVASGVFAAVSACDNIAAAFASDVVAVAVAVAVDDVEKEIVTSLAPVRCR